MGGASWCVSRAPPNKNASETRESVIQSSKNKFSAKKPLVRLGAFVGKFWCIPTKGPGKREYRTNTDIGTGAREASQTETHDQKYSATFLFKPVF